jgi:hypothetical protein
MKVKQVTENRGREEKGVSPRSCKPNGTWRDVVEVLLMALGGGG